MDELLEKQERIKKEDENTILGTNYTRFIMKNKYNTRGARSDCLNHAERCSSRNPKYDKNACVFSVQSSSKKTPRKFGVSDSTIGNLRNYTRNYVATPRKNPMYNHNVNPNIGDTYAMIPYVIPKDKGICPYHVATVIFKDGNTNITTEADASRPTKYPIFDMYSVSDHRFSFYTIHQKTYTLESSDSSTRKLRPTVLNLLANPKTRPNNKPSIKIKRTRSLPNLKKQTQYLKKRAQSAGKKNKTMKNKLVNE